MSRPPRTLWVSTARETRGGVAAYVNLLATTPLWSRWGVRHVATHRDGPAATKVAVFVGALLRIAAELLFRRLAGERGLAQRIELATRLIKRGSGELPPG